MELVKKPIGDVGDATLEIVSGKIVAKAKIEKDLGDGAVVIASENSITLTPKVLGDFLKAKIPGKIDDFLIDLAMEELAKLG